MAFRRIGREGIDLKDLQRDSGRYVRQAVTYMEFYNKALENLVEGQREVVNNDDFEFEDGSTVGERLKRVEDRLRKFRVLRPEGSSDGGGNQNLGKDGNLKSGSGRSK